ncbi:MAG TPA: phosphosulfolactate synthase [Nocardioidaceae bacterium]|nr:phosphosulfolactate synthase [Nocardioidaceae bacterium]
MTLPTFLTLPHRGSKPREIGVTHVLDRGVSVATTESVLSTAADYIDLWKFGWGTAYLDPGLRNKLALLADAGVGSCLGGTLLEIAWAQGKEREFLNWAHEVGFSYVEVSRGVAPMPTEVKQELIRTAASWFEVLAEVGSKDPDTEPEPDLWADEIASDLRAGARWVIAEGRESGTVGLYRADGSVREDVVAAAVRGGGTDRVLFEAPRKDQQAWLIRKLGPEVNLANIALDDALALETLRRGLRADTFQMAKPPVPS